MSALVVKGIAQIEEVDDFKVDYVVNEDTFDPIDSDKQKEDFRNYQDSARQERVEKFYKEQHTKQTVEFVQDMRTRYLQFQLCDMTIWQAMEYLEQVVDDSDPDTNLSQMEHALQSAEAVRRRFPENEWLQIVALIHDLGKLLAVQDPHRGMQGLPQWAVVGDTFPVGCPYDLNANVFPQYFELNTDSQNPQYSQEEYGIYAPEVGFSNMLFSWGHDEYLYQVLANHPQCLLPEEALYVIRFHSFYPWHRYNGYSKFANNKDHENLQYLLLFNEFDLYSKSDDLDDMEQLKDHYRVLVEKYIPGTLKW